jgi:hypothetical protein
VIGIEVKDFHVTDNSTTGVNKIIIRFLKRKITRFWVKYLVIIVEVFLDSYAGMTKCFNQKTYPIQQNFARTQKIKILK